MDALEFTERREQRLAARLAEQERRGLFIGAAVRTAIMHAVLLWQLLDSPMAGAAYIYGIVTISIFCLTSILHVLFAYAHCVPRIMIYALFAVDAFMMAFFFTYPNPYLDVDIPLYLALRWDNFHWYFIILAQAAMALNWRLVAWCGLLVVLARLAQIIAILNLSEAFTESAFDTYDMMELKQAYLNVAFVSVGQRIGEFLAIIGVTCGLVAVTLRSKRLVRQQSDSERARASLARYFSPNIVDQLSSRTEVWPRPRRLRVAVLFVDIVGFTARCAQRPPEEAVALLQGYHRHIVPAIFDHGGTLDKYLGDGVMVSFGTAQATTTPASNALACARAIRLAINDWNRSRSAQGDDPIAIGIGIDVGEAIVGDIGDQRRMEFTAIGDVVNRASRLESHSRNVTGWLVASDAVRQSAVAEGGDVTDLQPLGPTQIRGYGDAFDLWMIAEPTPVETSNPNVLSAP